MESIRQYILSVCAASVLCGILGTLFQRKSSFLGVFKLLTGIFLIIVIISPLVDIKLPENIDFFSDLPAEAKSITNAAAASGRDTLKGIIKGETEAYILDKTTQKGVDATVTVDFTDTDPPLLKKITIIGSASPLSRQMLIDQLSEELGLPKESVIWSSNP